LNKITKIEKGNRPRRVKLMSDELFAIGEKLHDFGEGELRFLQILIDGIINGRRK
jgi:hypothetical protein